MIPGPDTRQDLSGSAYIRAAICVFIRKCRSRRWVGGKKNTGSWN